MVIIVAVVAIAFGWALGSLRPTLLVVTAVAAVLAASALTRARGRAGRAGGAALPDAGLARQVASVLDHLDPIEHHRIDHVATPQDAAGRGVPGSWPQLWVGPTGLRVVDVCSGSSQQVCPVGAAARAEQVDTLVHRSRATLAGPFGDVEVRAVVVTPDGTRCGVGCCPAGADVVAPVALSAAITSGTVLPMARVEQVASRVAAALADPTVEFPAPSRG